MTFTTTSRTLVGAMAVAVLALSACGTDGDQADVSPTAAAGVPGGNDVETLEAVVWNQGEGNPELDFDMPLAVTTPVSRLVGDGDGDQVEPGQVVSIHYTEFNAADGEILYSTYDNDAVEQLAVGTGELEPALDQLFTSSRVGANILFATPAPNIADAAGNPGTVLIAITIESVSNVLDRAEGTPVDPQEGLPEVTLDDTGAPSLQTVDTDPSEELIAQLLIEGEGPNVAPGASVTVHYTGWLWDGTQFDSSWERGQPATFSLAGGVIEGWIQGLEGQPVGSQVLLVIPPELGYGEAGSATIPPGATLVFVVDILGSI